MFATLRGCSSSSAPSQERRYRIAGSGVPPGCHSKPRLATELDSSAHERPVTRGRRVRAANVGPLYRLFCSLMVPLAPATVRTLTGPVVASIQRFPPGHYLARRECRRGAPRLALSYLACRECRRGALRLGLSLPRTPRVQARRSAARPVLPRLPRVQASALRLGLSLPRTPRVQARRSSRLAPSLPRTPRVAAAALAQQVSAKKTVDTRHRRNICSSPRAPRRTQRVWVRLEGPEVNAEAAGIAHGDHA